MNDKLTLLDCRFCRTKSKDGRSWRSHQDYPAPEVAQEINWYCNHQGKARKQPKELVGIDRNLSYPLKTAGENDNWFDEPSDYEIISINNYVQIKKDGCPKMMQ